MYIFKDKFNKVVDSKSDLIIKSKYYNKFLFELNFLLYQYTIQLEFTYPCWISSFC